MSVSVTMPMLGESVTEGTVTRWLKQVGDTVAVDEPLLEVSTDKVDTEIPSPVAGVLLSIAAPEDAVVPVGGELGVIGAADESATAPAAPAPAPAIPAPAPSVPTPVPAPAVTAPAEASAAPLAPPAAPVAAPTASGATTAVVLPALGESVTEGTVTRWLKAVGDPVAVDEPLVEISTDKVDTELPSPAAGTLLEILVGEDQVVEVGATLGLIGTAGAPSAAALVAPAPAAPPVAAPPVVAPVVVPAPAAPAPATAPAAPAAPAAAPAAAVTADDGGKDSYVTPLVRKLAADNGVDLAAVTGTGVEGCLTTWYAIGGADTLSTHVLPKGAGVGTWSGLTVSMTNDAANQDVCKLATIVITYALAA